MSGLSVSLVRKAEYMPSHTTCGPGGVLSGIGSKQVS
jgi:hypothetical protein